MNIKETHHSLNPSNISNPMSNQIKQFHLIPNQLQNKNAPQDDTGTTITNIAFITKGIQNYDIENLNCQKEAPKDGIKIGNNQKETKPTPTKVKSFVERAKNWVGNKWNSIKKFKIKNLIPKTEYKIFRNANGDLVNIPVKKIPLKKKKEENEIMKNKISYEQNRIVSIYDGVANGMYLVA